MDEVILSRIRQEAYEQGYQDGKVDGYNLAGTQMSVAKQERNRGKWTHDGSKWANRFICSECWYKLFDEPTNFCPNCGADMRGGEDATY